MIRELIKKQRLFCDGGMGSMLVSMGLESGEASESWNLSHPDKITEVHRAYLNAGADIITANTFGINCEKYENYDQMIAAALNCAKVAVGAKRNKFIALDIGPTGRLLEPLGD
ncbi:MAG: homocysteine S-methyltransferase family protein, partial [Clostridia bacterium]|nr:homocysteine S-methyltransferase family protein [Clostridia bacterium]